MTPQIKQRIEQLRHGQVPEGYKKTKIGIVPEEWEETMFSDLFTSTSDFTEDLDQYPLYSLTIENGITAKTDRYERSHLVKKENAYKIVRPNDFAYNPMNVRFGAVARHKGNIDVCVSGYYDIFTTKDESDLEFMDSFLISDKMIAYYNRISIGSLVEKQRVHFSQFMDFRLPLPSPTERKKIAEILSAQDKLIALKEKLIEEKKRQKKYLMQQLLTGKKRLPGFSGEWYHKRLCDFCDFIGGGTPDTKNDAYWRGDIPWISSSDLSAENLNNVEMSRYITEDAIASSATKQCPTGSILVVTRVGVGKVAIAPVELCTSQDFTSIIQHQYNNVFVAYAIWELMQEKTAQVQGSSIKGIPSKEFQQFKIMIPPHAEQNAIVNILSAVDHEIDLLDRDLDQEKQKKKALMQLLLSGVVRVNV